MKLKSLLASAAVLALLGGCFGGDGGEEPAAVDDGVVPASALTSASAFSLYVQTVANGDSMTMLDLEGVTVPQSETALPIDGA